jgi:23S rRNA-/tRNA-specific pseudouridylate synthase
MSAPPLRVLLRDVRWLAVDKPPGLPTTPGTSGISLVDRVRTELAPGASVLHPLSRLDHDVTGVVLFALDRDAALHADRARAREEGYRRTYLALVSPPPARDEFVWDWPIGVDPADPHRRVADRGRDPQTARTVGHVRELRGGVGFAELHPVTGRTHQLRVHARRAGCPIVGDRTYGGARRIARSDGEVIAIPRVLLHCAQLALEGGPTVRSQVPEDFTRCWESLVPSRR